MQLTSGTDYAIRVIVYLAATGRMVTSNEISKEMGVPYDYLRAIVTPLRAAGMVASRKGSQGGYSLAKPAEDITLLDIVRITEDTTRINRCLEHDRYCSRFATEHCPVRKCYVQVQDCLDEALNSITVARLVANADKSEDSPEWQRTISHMRSRLAYSGEEVDEPAECIAPGESATPAAPSESATPAAPSESSEPTARNKSDEEVV